MKTIKKSIIPDTPSPTTIIKICTLFQKWEEEHGYDIDTYDDRGEVTRESISKSASKYILDNWI